MSGVSIAGRASSELGGDIFSRNAGTCGTGRPASDVIARDLVKHCAITAAVGVTYFATAKLGHLVAIYPGTVTPVGLPSGFALVAVLLYGPRVWPGIWLAAFLADVPALIGAATWLEFSHSVAVGAGIASGSALEPLFGAYMFALATGRLDIDPMESVRSLVALFLLAGWASCAAAATIGVTSLAVSGSLPWTSYSYAWITWWVGNSVGVMLVAPLLLAWRRLPQWLISPHMWFKPVALLLVLTAFSFLLFGDWLGRDVSVPLAFITVPVLTWLAYSYGRHGATLGIALVSAVALINTAQGRGPFAGAVLNDSLLLLQICIAMVCVTGLAMSAAVSERRNAELDSHRLNSALAHAGRVSLTGEMAAGMAHEFHQPLSVIANYANSCLIRLRRGETLGADAVEPLQKIVDETMRAARVIRGVRGFLRKSEAQQEPTSINALVVDAMQLARMATDDSNVEITLLLDTREPEACVDASQVTQVLMNLIVNAVDAMRDTPRIRQRIEITTRAQADMVEVRVADGGPGIPDEDHESCFERFHTTKDNGLGMGLAICRTLVENHGGRLWIERSAVLGGAEFAFTLSCAAITDDVVIPPGKL